MTKPVACPPAPGPLEDCAALINVSLADSNLAACYAAGVHWELCSFFNIDLRKTRLNGATLDRSDFRGAHLQEANLEGATLRGANLRDADLRDSNLTRADLRGADLSGAHLLGAHLADVQTDQATTWPAGFTS